MDIEWPYNVVSLFVILCLLYTPPFVSYITLNTPVDEYICCLASGDLLYLWQYRTGTHVVLVLFNIFGFIKK